MQIFRIELGDALQFVPVMDRRSLDQKFHHSCKTEQYRDVPYCLPNKIQATYELPTGQPQNFRSENHRIFAKQQHLHVWPC
jgi:hypothetical protein